MEYMRRNFGFQTPEPLKAASPPPEEQTGILQRWFPGWGGWYGSSQTGTEGRGTTQGATQEVGEPPTKIRKSDSDLGTGSVNFCSIRLCSVSICGNEQRIL
jgi:hypothetical protein